MSYINKNDLDINSTLYEFVNNEILPGTDINSEDFWKKFGKVVHELAPINKALIQKREDIQKKIDVWHKENTGKDFNKDEYINFLKSISYLVDVKKDFKIDTLNVDEEISSIAGPQLVVPVDNARYAINAANARWGSLYDALYGTDVINGEKGTAYNKERGNRVISYVRKFLNQVFPLKSEDWEEISKIQIEDEELILIKNGKNDY